MIALSALARRLDRFTQGAALGWYERRLRPRSLRREWQGREEEKEEEEEGQKKRERI